MIPVTMTVIKKARDNVLTKIQRKGIFVLSVVLVEVYSGIDTMENSTDIPEKNLKSSTAV